MLQEFAYLTKFNIHLLHPTTLLLHRWSLNNHRAKKVMTLPLQWLSLTNQHTENISNQSHSLFAP